jgi:hypothetical protein
MTPGDASPEPDIFISIDLPVGHAAHDPLLNRTRRLAFSVLVAVGV